MKKFRFHVVSLPHSQTTSEFSACAYTMKVVKFCNMMKDLGHEVFLYASEDNEARCTELITVVSKKDQLKWFGQHDYQEELFSPTYDKDLVYWQEMNKRTIKEINKRKKDKDFICVIAGFCQEQIATEIPELFTVEFGIGYEGVFSKYKVFESYGHMQYVYGTQHSDNGNFYDTVIPNYWDPSEFPLVEKKDDYYLFVGRLIPRKGPTIAADLVNAVNGKLVLVGQGVEKIEGDTIYGKDVVLKGKNLLHLGYADPKKRGELMSRAKAVFLCSTYLEPFGGTSIEPLFCGTPVITTDWGGFPENIINGKVGYRIRTFGEGLWAIQNLDKLLPPKKLREYAVKNFSMKRVAVMYQAYFEQLDDLWRDGWYSKNSNGQSKYHRYDRYIPE